MNRWKGLLLAALSAAAIFLFGRLAGRRLKGNRPPGIDPVWLLALLPIVFAVLLWHELGHIIGGWLAGFRMHLLAAGPLRIDRHPSGYKVSFNKSISLWGGIASSSPPPDQLQNLPRRMLLMVAGGPVASLTAALLLTPIPFLATDPVLRILAGAAALLNGAIGLITAIPQSFGGFHSDGLRVWQLLRGGPTAARLGAVTALGALAQEVRPRNWPRDLVDDATANIDNSYDGITAAWLAHLWHLDRDEIAPATGWLEETLSRIDHWPPAARPLIYSTAAYFFAVYTDDTTRAQACLAKCETSGFLPPEGLLMSQAAVAQATGNHTKARELIRAGKALVATREGEAALLLNEYFDRIAGPSPP